MGVSYHLPPPRLDSGGGHDVQPAAPNPYETADAVREPVQNGAEYASQMNEQHIANLQAAGQTSNLEHAEVVGKGLNAVGAVGGVMEGASGVSDIAHGKVADGSIKVAEGVKNTVGSVASMTGNSGVAKAMGPVGTVIDGVKTVNDIREGHVEDAVVDGASTVLDVALPEVVLPIKGAIALGHAMAPDLTRQHPGFRTAQRMSPGEAQHRLSEAAQSAPAPPPAAPPVEMNGVIRRGARQLTPSQEAAMANDNYNGS